MTNGKSRTPFRLVPKSTTLDDLERPIRALLHLRHLGVHRKSLNEKRQNVGQLFYFLRYKAYADIRGRFTDEGASNDSGVVDNGNFQRFCWLFFRKL